MAQPEEWDAARWAQWGTERLLNEAWQHMGLGPYPPVEPIAETAPAAEGQVQPGDAASGELSDDKYQIVPYVIPGTGIVL